MPGNIAAAVSGGVLCFHAREADETYAMASYRAWHVAGAMSTRLTSGTKVTAISKSKAKAAADVARMHAHGRVAACQHFLDCRYTLTSQREDH